MSVQNYLMAIRQFGNAGQHTDSPCAKMEKALAEIINLPYCDSHMCRQIARDALEDTQTVVVVHTEGR